MKVYEYNSFRVTLEFKNVKEKNLNKSKNCKKMLL